MESLGKSFRAECIKDRSRPFWFPVFQVFLFRKDVVFDYQLLLRRRGMYDLNDVPFTVSRPARSKKYKKARKGSC